MTKTQKHRARIAAKQAAVAAAAENARIAQALRLQAEEQARFDALVAEKAAPVPADAAPLLDPMRARLAPSGALLGDDGA